MNQFYVAREWTRWQLLFAALMMACVAVADISLPALAPLNKTDLFYPTLFAVILLSFAVLLWRETLLPWAAAAVILLGLAEIFWRAWWLTPGIFPEFIEFAIFGSLSATVFIGPRFGDLITLLVFAYFAALWNHQTWMHTDFFAVKRAFNFALMLLVLQLLLRFYWQRLREGLADLARAAADQEEHAREIHVLARTAFEDFTGALEDLQNRLQRNPPDLKGASVIADGLAALLTKRRSTLKSLPEPSSPGNTGRRLESLRSSLRTYVLGALALAWSLALIRNAFQSGRITETTLEGAAFFAAAAFLHSRSPKWGPWGFRAALVANQWLIFGFDWLHRSDLNQLFSANNPVAVFLIFIGALLDSPALAGALVLGELVALAAFTGAQVPVGGVYTVLHLCFALVTASLLWTLPWRLEAIANRRGRELKQSASWRRRLLGTLFHDLANPLNVLLLGLEIGLPTEKSKALVVRMKDVLISVENFGEGPLRLRAVDLGSMQSELAELFEARVKSKKLDLRVEIPERCKVLADPALLRESVFGNLLGNAVKFSPPGGSVRFTARRDDAWIFVTVTNSGNAIPQKTLSDLENKLLLTSTPGSLGETGSGIGLGQVRDYVQSMGGQFSIEAGPEGGAKATVRLMAVP